MRVGLVIGHSRRGDEGAVSYNGYSEWEYHHKILFPTLVPIVKQSAEVTVISHLASSSYSAAMTELAAKLRAAKVDFVISFHFNSFDKKASGFEQLYWHSSTRGKLLAHHLNYAQSQLSSPSPNRGIKPIVRGKRGSQFLRKTHCPAVIQESFFGDNPDECQWYFNNVYTHALFIASGIRNFIVSK